MKQRFAYVQCAFVAGAVIAFACLIHSSILARESTLHWIVDNVIEAAVTAFPDSSLARQLQMHYTSAQPYVPSPLRSAERQLTAMLGEVSDQIKRDPENLDLRLRRASICQLQQNHSSRGELLQVALSDAEYVVSHRGNAEDWAHLSALQGMNNDSRWSESLKQAKKLGYKPGPNSAGVISWVVASLRDGGYRQANIIPWLRAMAEVTGEHGGDYFIATIYFQAGKYEDAAREYDNLIKNGVEKESRAMFYLLKGACLKWSGQPTLAKEAFQACVALPGEVNAEYKAMARGALGDRSLEKTLDGQPVTERVLYYVLSDQYEKALQVTATRKPKPKFDAFGGCDAFGDVGPQGGDVQVDAPDPGTDSFDQFEMATGLKQLPQPVVSPEKKDILEGPADAQEMIIESTANIHFLKEMAHRKTNNETFVETEHRLAIKFVPPNLRRELGVQ